MRFIGKVFWETSVFSGANTPEGFTNLSHYLNLFANLIPGCNNSLDNDILRTVRQRQYLGLYLK